MAKLKVPNAKRHNLVIPDENVKEIKELVSKYQKIAIEKNKKSVVY